MISRNRIFREFSRWGIIVLLTLTGALAGCDSVEKACKDCCDIPLIRGLCTQSCKRVAESMQMSPGDVRRDCPGR